MQEVYGSMIAALCQKKSHQELELVQAQKSDSKSASDEIMHSSDSEGKIGLLNCANSLGSSISFVDDEYEVTKFIDTTSCVSEEIMSDTPIKQTGSASSLKIITCPKGRINNTDPIM